MFERLTYGLSRIGATIATCGLFIIMASATLDVASRNVGGRSVPGVVEIAEIVLVIGVFLGLAYAQRLKAHVATSLFTEMMPKPVARTLRGVGLLVVGAYIALAAYVSAVRAWEAFLSGEVRFGLIEIPQWPARAAIAIGFAILFLEVLRDTVRALRGEGTSDPAAGGL